MIITYLLFYIMIGVVAGVMFDVFVADEPGPGILFGIFWPLALPGFGLLMVYFFLYEKLKKLK